MFRRGIVQLIAALACGVLLAGCGGGKASSGSQTGSTPAASPATTMPFTGTGTVGSRAATTPAGGANASALARAVASCRAAIAATPGLSPALNSKVERICAKAAGGDLAGARKAAKEVCAAVINALRGSAAVKQQARARCSGV